MDCFVEDYFLKVELGCELYSGLFILLANIKTCSTFFRSQLDTSKLSKLQGWVESSTEPPVFKSRLVDCYKTAT
jgi:hypothetical protein